MSHQARSALVLPSRELDTRAQAAARANVSVRTIIRFEELGMPVLVLDTPPTPNSGSKKKRPLKRYDPQQYMPWIRGERPPPEPVRRGRPRKR